MYIQYTQCKLYYQQNNSWALFQLKTILTNISEHTAMEKKQIFY